MRWDKSDVRLGMPVTSTTGQRLGKVIRCDSSTFVVEKGTFFPKDYELRYDHIAALNDDSISYSLSDSESSLEPSRASVTPLARGAASTEAAPRTTASTAAAGAARTRAAQRERDDLRATDAARTERQDLRASDAARSERQDLRATDAARGGREDIRIPLMEEELGVEKVARETGHVRIHKTIKIEEKHFTVPVRREEVVIERVAATPDMAPASESAAFREQTLDLPLHEEEVQVSKRPRIREQMVVRTVVQAVEKEGSASLRHEEAEVEDTRRTSSSSGDTPAETGGYVAPGSRR